MAGRSGGSIFVVSTATSKKPDPATRKLIRSHVMLGKNRGKARHGRSSVTRPLQDGVDSSDGTLFSKPQSLSIPRKIGSDLAFTPLPSQVEPRAALEAIQHLHSVAKTKYTLEPCLVFRELEKDWLAQLTTDASFLQSVVLMVQIHFDTAGGHRINTYPRQMHFLKTLQLLREKLVVGKTPTLVSDATLFSIANLATYAHVYGEDKTARQHLEATRKLVDLRGGLYALGEVKLQIEVFRCDIGISLRTGSDPIFFRSNEESEPFLPYPNEISAATDQDEISDCLNATLARVWGVMKKFCSLINLSVEAHGRIPWALIHNTMTAVMYRLLHMRFAVGAIDEAVRLCLLAFCSQVFLHWKFVNITYTHMNSRFKESMIRLVSWHSIPPQLYLWLFTVGGISLSEPCDRAWVKPRIRKCIDSYGITSWGQVQRILQSSLWIPMVQQDRGNELINSALEL
ncbi:hypothetical protein BX600DRAFT_467145 [Xylariales sp. PMI_506]|nr:hypothetical protein BX600DRAFT_467145 [Xylariales sp. PMI_506]